MKSVVKQGFCHEFTFDNTVLKHSWNFKSVKTFEVRMLSNLNFVTSLITTARTTKSDPNVTI